MTKWEYATVPLLVHATKQILDNWGDDGWELVALVPGPNSEQLVAYMKRPKESSDPPEARLAALGLALPPVAAPLAAYVPAVRSGRHVYTAGQLPLADGKLLMTGRVGAQVSVEEAATLARTCALNALAAVASVTGGLSAVTRIVKIVGYVASDPSFTGQPLVVNGASELMLEVFGDAGRHARSAVRGGGPAARRAGRDRADRRGQGLTGRHP